MMNEHPAPHSLEPQFRKLGLATYLVKGVPTLKAPHTVCKKGDTLNPNQVNLLQLFGKTFSEVSIHSQVPATLSRLSTRAFLCAYQCSFCALSSKLCRGSASTSQTAQLSAVPKPIWSESGKRRHSARRATFPAPMKPSRSVCCPL